MANSFFNSNDPENDSPFISRDDPEVFGIKPWTSPDFTELPFRNTLGTKAVSADNPAPGSYYAVGQVPAGTPSKTPTPTS
jgi:hypothetical protein